MGIKPILADLKMQSPVWGIRLLARSVSPVAACLTNLVVVPREQVMGKALQQLLEFKGDVENTYCRLFSAEYAPLPAFVLPRCCLPYCQRLLAPRPADIGAGVALTAENRKEYVDLIAKQFNVGFRRIVTRLFFGFVAWSLCFR